MVLLQRLVCDTERRDQAPRQIVDGSFDAIDVVVACTLKRIRLFGLQAQALRKKIKGRYRFILTPYIEDRIIMFNKKIG